MPIKRRSLRAAVAQRDGGICVDCPPEAGPWQYWEADHIIPLSLGGPDVLDNMATRCASHHRAKTSAEGGGGRPNRDMVMMSVYLGRSQKAEIAELAAERGEPWAQTARTLLAYGVESMNDDGWPAQIDSKGKK